MTGKTVMLVVEDNEGNGERRRRVVEIRSWARRLCFLAVFGLSVPFLACSAAGTTAPAPTAPPPRPTPTEARLAAVTTPTPAAAPLSPTEEIVVGDGDVVIGAILPLTGNFSGLGQTALAVVRTVEDIVDGDHPAELKRPLRGQGLAGLNGRRLKFVVVDDASQADLAGALAKHLISEDKVRFLVGDEISGNSAAIQQVAEASGVPYGCHACASPSLTEKGLKWFWRTGPNDVGMVSVIFTFLREWPQNGGPNDLRTIALFSCDNLFCQDARKVALDSASRSGLQVVEDVTGKVGAATYEKEIRRLQAAAPDVLLVIHYAPEGTIYQREAKELGFGPRVVIFRDGALSDRAWLQEQNAANGVAGYFRADPTTVDLASKNQRWQMANEVFKKYSQGRSLDEWAMRVTTGLLWTADVVNRAGSTDPAALAKAAQETDWGPDLMITSYRGIKFDDKHQNVLALGAMAQMGWDGEPHTVWPWEARKEVGYTILYPNPTWSERGQRPKPR